MGTGPLRLASLLASILVGIGAGVVAADMRDPAEPTTAAPDPLGIDADLVDLDCTDGASSSSARATPRPRCRPRSQTFPTLATCASRSRVTRSCTTPTPGTRTRRTPPTWGRGTRCGKRATPRHRAPAPAGPSPPDSGRERGRHQVLVRAPEFGLAGPGARDHPRRARGDRHPAAAVRSGATSAASRRRDGQPGSTTRPRSTRSTS